MASRFSIRAPLLLSIALGALNCLLISASMWISKPTPPPTVEESSPLRSSEEERPENFWLAANPLGAAAMLSRSRRLLVSSGAYCLICLAHAGVQSAWVNYLQFRFGWNAAAAASTLTMVGLVVATLPPLVL